jgi:uncharacterized protein YecE (DUF72 family)
LFAAAPRARTAAVAGTLADVARTHGQIRIGTSGWSYGSWRGPFFPREVMVKHHLAYYASQFDTTELNGVFYRTPTVEAVRGWRTTTPDDILDLLHRHGVALCLSDHHDAPAPWQVTASHVYVRGHGPGGAYHGSYPARTLRRWAEHAQAWRQQGRTVFIYFDNDQKSAAPFDALRLIQLLDKPAKHHPGHTMRHRPDRDVGVRRLSAS